jgi:hypothetical protein
MTRIVMIASCLVMFACADDVEAPADELGEVEQQSCQPNPGARCFVQHPIGWVVNGVGCAERPRGTSYLDDGDEYTATSYPTTIYGSGKTTLSCQDGCLDTVPGSSWCRKAGGSPN